MIQSRKLHRLQSWGWRMLCGALLCSAVPSRAQDEADVVLRPTPTPLPKAINGPSAKKAAELEKGIVPPGKQWLLHYLPDDRYKIDGKVWKYVSTELDTYYHVPNSPLMLRQPANIVIGFSSREQAEEAGYQPGPSVQSQIRESGSRGGNDAVRLRHFAKKTTITLSDGKSQVTVPAGWSYYPHPFRNTPYSLNIFLPKGTKFNSAEFLTYRSKKPPCVVILTMTFPSNINMEAMLNAENLRRQNSFSKGFAAGFASQNAEARGVVDDNNNQDISPSSWGGAKAVRIEPKTGSQFSTGVSTLIYAARGSKAYAFYDWTKGSKGANQLRNSFIAR